MHIRCSKCPWEMDTATYSDLLAEWLLQCHHWEMHGGKEPEVSVRLGATPAGKGLVVTAGASPSERQLAQGHCTGEEHR